MREDYPLGILLIKIIPSIIIAILFTFMIYVFWIFQNMLTTILPPNPKFSFGYFSLINPVLVVMLAFVTLSIIFSALEIGPSRIAILKNRLITAYDNALDKSVLNPNMEEEND